ncbi:MAG: hypothetical protein JSU86_13280 [Phycisphaerales bacterium]|nr:MAG: hypothetical protein JSU86_13280 [Phycisphaerales bacterium]
MNDHNRRRRGSVYVVVLGVAMIVTVIGLSALAVVRIERRSLVGGTDFGQARLYAHSAIEMGFFWIRDDPTWRDNRPSGVWVEDQLIGDGTFTLEVKDPDDNNLKTEPNNFIVLTGTGVRGDARFKLQVTVVPDRGGYEISSGTWRQVVD